MTNAQHDVMEPPVLVVLFVGFAAVVVHNAWLSDDAFITLRTVDHFVRGFGLRYNVVERVQSYTHPLWMGVVSALYFWTREAYYTLLSLSRLFFRRRRPDGVSHCRLADSRVISLGAALIH